MLREILHCRQIQDDRFRRWFTDGQFDLFVWYEDREIYGFQLCYNKLRHERALTWRRDCGWSHHSVDGGHGPLDHGPTPVLRPNGTAPITAIIKNLEIEAAAIDPDILDFVLEKLAGARLRMAAPSPGAAR